MIRGILLAFALLVAAPALAQNFPPLTGRVVDNADLLTPAEEAELTQKLEALERASSRQLVVATFPDLQGYSVEEFGLGLGRAWGIGQGGANNGVILLIGVAERKIRIEVGYGLEGVMTDALSSRIIRDQITPRFREQNPAAGIMAGADAIIEQLQAPPEAAEQRALAAAQEGAGDSGASFLPLLFWLVVLGFILIPMLFRGMRGKKYRGRRGRRGPVVIWGPGLGSGGGSSWGGSSWSGGGGGWGGGGGFSGGGGSFGGGGASGGW